MIAAVILEPAISSVRTSFWIYPPLNHTTLNVFGIWAESALYNVFMFWCVYNIIFCSGIRKKPFIARCRQWVTLWTVVPSKMNFWFYDTLWNRELKHPHHVLIIMVIRQSFNTNRHGQSLCYWDHVARPEKYYVKKENKTSVQGFSKGKLWTHRCL